jgi:hypothetical protein
MASERNPDDPSRVDRTTDELLRMRAEQVDAKLQADPELAEGPAAGGRIALFAIALVVILGVVLYGLNSSFTTPEPASTAQTTPAAPPPAGQTTGQAPRQPTGQPAGQAPGAAPTPMTTPAEPPPPPTPTAPAKQ